MSTTARDFFSGHIDLLYNLHIAERNARTRVGREFVKSLKERYSKNGFAMDLGAYEFELILDLAEDHPKAIY